MEVDLKRKENTVTWEGDGMRPGDNIRAKTEMILLVIVELDSQEKEDTTVVQVAKEFDGKKTNRISVSDIETDIKERIAYLKWCAAWKSFFNQKVANYFYVGTDFAPPDRPEVYDYYGNFLMILPKEVAPGDFATISKILQE